VSSTGLVTSLGPSGLASVTVSSAGFAVLVPVAVTQVPTRLVVIPANPQVALGRTLRLDVTALDAVNVAIPGVTFQFTSLTPALVSVSANGVVTSLGALGNGMVRVTALGTPLSVDVPVAVLDFGSPTGSSLQLISSPLMYAVDFIDSERLIATSHGSAARLFDLRNATSSVINAPVSFGVAVARTRNKAYIPSNGLVELDLTAGTVRNAALEGQLFDIVLSADERTAYVGTAGDVIYIVDVLTMTLTRQLLVPRGGLHLALSPSGTKLYASAGEQGITETDIASGAVQVIQTGLTIQALALTRDGRTLYGVSEGGSVFSMELATRQTRTFQTPGCGGWGMAISRDDEKLVISCSRDDRIVMYEARTGTLLHTFQNIGEPRRVSMSLDGYVAAVGTAGGVAIIR